MMWSLLSGLVAVEDFLGLMEQILCGVGMVRVSHFPVAYVTKEYPRGNKINPMGPEIGTLWLFLFC